MINSLLSDLRSLANPMQAKNLFRFFKTGKGEYGEGDQFLGITVPEQRKIAKKYKDLPFEDIEKLIKNPFHECRFVALLILVYQAHHPHPNPTNCLTLAQAYNFYLSHTKYINNWDLVDLSAPNIVGEYLYNCYKSSNRYNNYLSILASLACSANLWERRISIISTLAFIRNNKFDITLKISEILLNDKHDLIHKATGWMLREVGRRDKKTLLRFLDTYASRMPRTMLRYAIEKFPEPERQKYLSC